MPGGPTPVNSAATASGTAEPNAELKAACLQSFSAAQDRRDEQQLLAARSELLTCAQAGCPVAVRIQCAEWLREVQELIPSLVIAVKDAHGQDTIAVRISLDGKLVAEQLGSRPLELDPGQHLLRFEHAGLPAIEKRIVVKQGERLRRLGISFEQPAGPVPVLPPDGSGGDETQSTGISPWVWVGFGVGGAGLLVGLIAGSAAASQSSDLIDQCDTTGCTEGDIDRVKAVAHVSTAGFVVGAAGITAGVIALLVDGSSSATGRRDKIAFHPWAGSRNDSFTVEPLISPFAVGLRGSF